MDRPELKMRGALLHERSRPRVSPGLALRLISRRRSWRQVLLALMFALWPIALFAGNLEAVGAAVERGDFRTAIHLLQPLAEQGEASAQLNLGALYHDGLGVPQDFAKAAHWYEKAAAQGNANAQNKLGLLYAVGLGVPQDYVETVRLYGLAAEQGAAKHQFDLAVMYDNGLGVAKDPAQAVQWYVRAAEQGLTEAEASLGLLYQRGEGVERDLAKALALFKSAAAKGEPRAQNNLALMYTKGDGVPRDYEAAVSWFSKAAAQGLASAMTNLGVMYDNGFGVTQDDAKAVELYRRAGRQGTVELEAVLAEMGLPYDARLAPLPEGEVSAEGLRLAAEQGDPVAQFMLGHVHAHGLVGEPDLRAAARWYQKAAAAGLTSAMTNLGLLYLQGAGVPQDYVLGYMWINLAAGSGQRDAIRVREAISSRMTPAQVNEAQRLASRQWARSTGESRP